MCFNTDNFINLDFVFTHLLVFYENYDFFLNQFFDQCAMTTSNSVFCSNLLHFLNLLIFTKFVFLLNSPFWPMCFQFVSHYKLFFSKKLILTSVALFLHFYMSFSSIPALWPVCFIFLCNFFKPLFSSNPLFLTSVLLF